MSHVRARHRISPIQRWDKDRAGKVEAAAVPPVAALIDLAVPGLGQPDLDLDLGIGGRPGNARTAAEGGNRHWAAVRGREWAGGDRHRQRDGRVVWEREPGKAATGRCGCGGRYQSGGGGKHWGHLNVHLRYIREPNRAST